MTSYDRLTANPPDEHHEIGHEEGDTCGRYPEPDEDQPRGYRPKPCDGVMIYCQEGAERFETHWTECDTCGGSGH
jgi:hypothetical protein